MNSDDAIRKALKETHELIQKDSKSADKCLLVAHGSETGVQMSVFGRGEILLKMLSSAMADNPDLIELCDDACKVARLYLAEKVKLPKAKPSIGDGIMGFDSSN